MSQSHHKPHHSAETHETVLETSPVPVQQHVVHYVNAPNAATRSAVREDTKRSLGAIITGGIGAVLGSIGGGAYVSQKMLAFDTEVAARTRSDILSRSGLGAGIAESGISAGGFSDHSIREAHATELLKNSEYRFAKFARIWGRGTIEAVAAGAAGLLAAGAYLAVVPKKEKAAIPQHPVPEQVTQVMDSVLMTDAIATKQWQGLVEAQKAEKEVAPSTEISR